MCKWYFFTEVYCFNNNFVYLYSALCDMLYIRPSQRTLWDWYYICFQMKKLSLREVTSLTQGHTANNWQRKESDLGRNVCQFLTVSAYFLYSSCVSLASVSYFSPIFFLFLHLAWQKWNTEASFFPYLAYIPKNLYSCF